MSYTRIATFSLEEFFEMDFEGADSDVDVEEIWDWGTDLGTAPDVPRWRERMLLEVEAKTEIVLFPIIVLEVFNWGITAFDVLFRWGL